MLNPMIASLIMIAVVCISSIEYISRTTASMPNAMLKSAPFVMVSQVCLYYVFSNGPSVMGAWLVFSLAMSAARMVNSIFILQEGLNPCWLAGGITCMVVAAYCMKQAHS
jgi:hypothetical protein